MENRPYGQITASDWVTSEGEVPGPDIIISRVLMIVNQCVVQDECETDMTETATASLLFLSLSLPFFPSLYSSLLSFSSPLLSSPLLSSPLWSSSATTDGLTTSRTASPAPAAPLMYYSLGGSPLNTGAYMGVLGGCWTYVCVCVACVCA